MVDSLKLIIKRNNLNLLYIFKNYFSIIYIIAFLIPAWTLVCVFIPFWIGSIQIVFVSIYLFVILGSLSYKWNNSTLKNNEIIYGTNRWQYYSSLLLTIFIIGNISSILLFAINVLLNKLDLILYAWIFIDSSHISKPFYWNQFEWYLLFYIIQINILLTFSIYFLIYRFFDDIKGYYSFLLIILVLSIIFGGSFNFSFSTDKLYFPDNYDVNKNVNFGYQYNKVMSLLPKWIFVPITLLIPFASIGQFFGVSVMYTLTIPSIYLGNYHSYTPFLLDFSNHNNWQWSLVLIMPYIHIILSGILGSFISKIKSFK